MNAKMVKTSPFGPLCLLVVGLSLVRCDNFVYDNFEYDWRCNITVTKNGTFPASTSTMTESDDLNHNRNHNLGPLLLPKWISENEQNFIQEWDVEEGPIGFVVKGNGPGEQNRIVLHLFSDLYVPLGSPLSEEDDVGDVTQSPSNCYVTDEATWPNEVVEINTICKGDLECLGSHHWVWKMFPCKVGVRSPVCCYTNYGHQPIETHFMRKLRDVYGDRVLNDLQMCQTSRFFNEQKIKDFLEECLPLSDTWTCNPYRKISESSCLVKDEVGKYIMPCTARCSAGLVMNLEFTLGENGSTHVSILEKSIRVDQTLYDLERDEKFLSPNVFIVDSTTGGLGGVLKTTRKEYPSLHLHPFDWNRIWIRWQMLSPPCLKDPTSNIQTPELWIGKEGSAIPLVKINFACETLGDDERSRFGWFGIDLFVPDMSARWRPTYVSVNSVENSNFSFSYGGKVEECLDLIYNLERPISTSLVVAIMLSSILVSFVFGVCFGPSCLESLGLSHKKKGQEQY